MPSIKSYRGTNIRMSYIDKNEYLRLENVYPHIKISKKQNSDSLERLFKTRYPELNLIENNCLKLKIYKQEEKIFCRNLKPIEIKQYPNFKLIDLNKKFATLEVNYYGGTDFYIINLETKTTYPISGLPNFSNSYELVYATYNDYGEECITILNLKNNTDAFICLGNSGWIIQDTYLITEEALRLKILNTELDESYRYIEISLNSQDNY